MADTNSTRLDRIEMKLDQLAEAVIALARAEEKIKALNDDHEEMRRRMDHMQDQLTEIKKSVDENSRTIQVINKFFWIFVTAITAVVAGQFYMG